MPELPEVETTVRYLAQYIIGLRITNVWADPAKSDKYSHGANWPRSLRQAGGLANLKKKTKNRKVLSVKRRAKYIIIDIGGPDFSSLTKSRDRKIEDPRFSNSDKSRKVNREKNTIFIHQKISGHLLYGQWKLKDGKWVSKIPGPLKDDRHNQYIRVVFFFDNGYQLSLSDQRRFGKIVLVEDKKIKDLPEIANLGPEPLDLNFQGFRKLFEKKKGKLKPVLLDPAFIAGIGNIYSDEILWDSGYHPLQRVEKLKDSDLKKIFLSMTKILKRGIKNQGASTDDYRLPSGESGKFQNFHNAYHQTGKKCKKRDGGVITRIKVGGRSAHFCDRHQKLK